MPTTRTTRRQRLFRGRRRIIHFQCPRCGLRLSPDQIEDYADAVRARRYRRHGRFVSVRQLRMFIEIARLEIDWDSGLVAMDILYRIIEHIAQMGDDESMDIDHSPPLIRDILNHLECLNLDETPEE